MGDFIGLGSQLKDLTKEYMKNPKVQYFRHLKKMLDLHKESHVSKDEVKEFFDIWMDGK